MIAPIPKAQGEEGMTHGLQCNIGCDLGKIRRKQESQTARKIPFDNCIHHHDQDQHDQAWHQEAHGCLEPVAYTAQDDHHGQRDE